MIIAERKPLKEIYEMLDDHKKILVLGCGTCVTICSAGGEKEVAVLSSELRIKSKMDNRGLTVDERTIERQCEVEFVEPLRGMLDEYDLVLSMACGVGVQTMVTVFTDKIVYPTLNTTSFGWPVEQGVWVENCRGCGNCRLHLTGGVCPVARCSKNLLNGPCGGTTGEGKCEVEDTIDCGWYLIYNQLKSQGKLDLLLDIRPANDWRKAGHGGPRTTIREDLKIEPGEGV